MFTLQRSETWITTAASLLAFTMVLSALAGWQAAAHTAEAHFDSRPALVADGATPVSVGAAVVVR